MTPKTLTTQLRIFITLLSACLVGCVTSPIQSGDPAEQARIWTLHQTKINALNQWEAKGRIGIRSTNESIGANLQWRQRHSHYQIHLTGPFGQGNLNLEGSDLGVSLKEGDNEYYAKTPELLLTQITGWSMPISDMVYWVRGIPTPKTPYQQRLNGDGTLKGLIQSGWTIEYLRYESFGPNELPTKLKLQRPDLSVTLVLHEWLPV